MQHEILGELTYDQEHGIWHGSLRYQSAPIELLIAPDDQQLEAVIQFASEVAEQLSALDKKAKQAATLELRETYNENWKDYDELQADGSYKSVTNPALSEADFLHKLTLNAINISGIDGIDFFYDDQNMFAGHSVVVTSLDGIEFNNTDASIFG